MLQQLTRVTLLVLDKLFPRNGARHQATDIAAALLALIARWSRKGEGVLPSALALEICGYYGLAADCYSQATRIDPECSSAWFRKGCLLRSLDRQEEAEAALRIASELEPDGKNGGLAWFWRARTLLDLERDDEAMACLDRALEIDSGYGQAWELMGVCYDNAGKLQEALLCYERALVLRPTCDSAWLNRGNALFLLGEDEEALYSLDMAIRFAPEPTDAWLCKGHVLEECGLTEEALQYYEKASEADPENVSALMDRAACLRELGRDEEAERCLDMVISLESRELDRLIYGSRRNVQNG